MTLPPVPAALAHIEDFGRFVTSAPSPFHAAAELARRLEVAGFVRQDETEAWDVGVGGHYLVRGGAVVAWRIPESVGVASAFRIVGAHTDSPAFQVKPHPDTTANGYQLVNVEVYGGMLRNSWLDRELGLAGRLVTVDGDETLVSTGPLMRIPQLAIHLDRKVNDGLVLDPQQHLHPVWSVGRPEASLLGHVAGMAGLAADEVAGFDLRSFDVQPPAAFGGDGEFFAAGRMDNLLSVHAGVSALIDSTLVDHGTDDIQVLACFDHEEVGSETRAGAAGPILEDVLVRTGHALGADADGVRRMYARSSVVSSDGGHAVHPNYPDRHDPAHQPVLNGGPLLKVNASQRYSTDAVGAALWARACRAAEVPSQVIVSNNAVPCGSTIGPITATRLGILTVDVGAPILSMHSAREMCGTADPYALRQALGAYWAGA
ncbi:M18 family aminopeptidase [Raineyella fluvialis]|uniref:M18 family aminopeptidase n=1 Tax=Raineyella fluvialis TaxID=2662261 RepID=A0A5Q2FJ23_9ACTN|nr:M18 family aminopeptidase [Raineyella fluvialis]